MATKPKTAKAETKSDETLIPNCSGCKYHGKHHQVMPHMSECELASIANRPILITGHTGVLYTADSFACNEFIEREK